MRGRSGRCATPTPRARQQTFRWLVDRVGSRRAGYLARLTKPTKTAAGLTFPDITPQQVDTPARVRLMPDHFIAIGWHGDNEIFRVAGNPVSDDLVASPDPTRAGVTIDANGLRTDPGMSWMFDYDAAVERGMAITVDLAGKTGLAEVTTLLVLGVDATDPDTGAKGLAALLAAHQRAGDFAFVPQGTPTNNTDSVAAGYTRHERELADLERRELGDPVRTRLAWDNAERFAMALGLPDAAPYRHAAFGDDTELLRSRAMRAALFEATLGTFIRLALPLHGGGQLVQRVLPPVRQWFIDEVTGGAPIPSIRIRNQPYGIVPVAAPAAPGPTDPTALKVRDVVDLLRNEWRFAAGGVVRLDHDAVDAAGAFTPDDIGIVLAGEPHPAEFAARGAEEFDTVETSGPFVPTGMYLIGGDGESVFYEWQDGYRGEWDEGLAALLEDTPHVHEELETFLAQYPEATGIEGQLSRWLAFRDHVAVLSEPQETDSGAMQSWRYLPEAVAAPARDRRPTRAALGPRAPAAPGAVARHRALCRRARREQQPAPADPFRCLDQGRAARSRRRARRPRQRARRRVPLRPPDPPRRGTDPYPVPDDAALLHQLVGQTVHHLRTADIPCLATLAAVDAPTLEWHARETLGLGTHRLDAWATSVVARQLLELRYPERVPAPGSQGGSPVQRGGVHVGAFGWVTGLRPRDSTASQGFVHTPSMGHAATAAILRSAWTARGEGSALAPAAVDIQSARVRTSEWLLDGVRNGQALGDLLGYRLERYLHAISLDALIAPLRHSVGAGQVPPDTTAEDPVDGLEALELWRAGTLYDGWPVADHPVPTDAQKAAVAFGLGLLELAFDAIDDATLFEATHQLVAGNIDRAGAVISSMGDVDLAPPELIAQRTPTAGPTIDHRVMVLIDAAAAADQRWSAGIRSKIAPQLESWVANLLPPPSTVGFRIGTGHDAAAGRLDGLGVSALDVLALAGDDPSTVSPGLAELVRLADPDHAAATIDAGDPAGAPASLAELQLLAIEIRRMVEAARPAVAADLLPSALVDPAAEPTPSQGVGQSVDAAGTVLEHLQWAIDHPDEARPHLARLGIVAPADDPAALVELARTRSAAMIEIHRSGGSGDDAVAAGLGRGVPLLTPFRGGPDAVTLGNDLADAAHIDDWIDLVAPVRPGVGRWTTVQLLGELLDAPTTTVLVTGQLPLQPGDPWAATAAPPASTGGRTVVTAQVHGAVDPSSTRPFVGLVLDRWSDRIPAPDQVTAVAVHHDAPSNRPPQTWLLVVPPAKKWTVNALASTVLDALEWAQLRAVALEDLGDFGHAIPTVMVPDDLLTTAVEPSTRSEVSS